MTSKDYVEAVKDYAQAVCDTWNANKTNPVTPEQGIPTWTQEDWDNDPGITKEER